MIARPLPPDPRRAHGGAAAARAGRALALLAIAALTAAPRPVAGQVDGAAAAGGWTLGTLEEHARDPSRLRAAVERIGAMEGTYGVLVVHEGELVLERYFREAYRDKPHNLKSASKSVLSALAGIAVADGRLELDRPISDYLPEATGEAGDDRRAITVGHLLTMTTGLEATSYDTYNQWIQSPDWIRAALELPLVATPGSRFQYSTGNTHLLSAVLTRAVGRSTREYAEEKLFGPLGVEIKGWERDPQGYYVGGNNLSLLPRDMARFGQLYLDGGRYGDRQVVPREWVARSTATSERGLHPVYGTYGMLWWTDLVYEGAFAAVGFGGQYIYVSPPHRAVVVITSTLESKGRQWTAELFEHLRIGILAALGPSTEHSASRGSGSGDPAIDALAAALERARASIAALAGVPDRTEGRRAARTVARVNLRRAPRTAAPRLALLERARPVEILGRADDWLQVRVDERTGWLHGDYVEIEDRGWRAAAADLRFALAAFSDALRPYFGGAWPPRPEAGEGPAAVARVAATHPPASGTATAELESRLEDSERARADLEMRLAALGEAADGTEAAREESRELRRRLSEAERELQERTEAGRLSTSELRQRSAEASRALEAAERVVERTAAERDAAVVRADALARSLEETEASLAAAEADREGHRESATELAETRRRLEATTAERDAAMERTDELARRLEASASPPDAAPSDGEATPRPELSESRLLLATTVAERDAALERAARLDGELTELRGRLAAIEEARVLADGGAAKATGQLAAISDELAAAREELTATRAALADADAAREAAEGRAKALTAGSLGPLRELLEAAEARRTETQVLADDLAAELRKLEERRSDDRKALERQREDLAGELSETRRRLEEAASGGAAAEERANRLETELAATLEARAAAEAEAAAARERAAALERELGEATARLAEVESDLSASTSTGTTLARELASERAGRAELEAELAAAAERLRELETATEAADERARAASFALSDLGERFERLRDELGAVEAERQRLASEAEAARRPVLDARGEEATGGETESPPRRPPPQVAGGAASVRRLVEAWAEAWSAGDAARHLGYYSSRFEAPDGADPSSWKERRRRWVEELPAAEVTVSDLQIAVLTEDLVKARFRWRLRAATAALAATKTLDLALENGRWRIVAEATGE